MIVLDQNGIVQPHAVVVPAAAADRVLLEHPPPRSGLARIENDRPGALDGRHEPSRERRDATQPLKEVQGRALECQDGTDRTGDLGDHVPRSSLSPSVR